MSAVLEALEPSARYLDAIEPRLVQQFDLLVGASAGVTRLREVILALAMKGKLVPQDPTDESAAQLVMRLIAERGESTLRRRMSTSTGVHPVGQASDSLPSSWAVASLSAISVKLTDGSHNPPRDAGSGIPMLSSQNVLESGAIDFDSPTRYVSIDDFERENTRTNVTPGDVLLTIVASLGRSAVVPVDAPAFVLQRSVAVIRTGLVPSFLAIFLRSPAARAYYDQHGKGTAQKGIYLGKLGELTLPIPPLAEQARIVARVDELMQLCDALEAKGRLESRQHARLLETLLGTLTESTTPEELAANWQRVAEHFDLLLDRPEAVDALEQTVLQLATSGRFSSRVPHVQTASVELADQGSAALPFSVPADWSWVSLGQLTSLVTSGSRSWKDYYSDEGATFIRSQDIKYDRLEFDNRAYVRIPPSAEGVRTQVRPRDVLITITGANVGKAAVVEEPLSEAYVSQHVALVRLLDPRIADYLHLWLVNEHGGRLRLLGSSYGAKPGLNLQNIKDLPVPLPPLEEQVRIVARVAELRRLCADLRQRLASSQATQSRLAGALVESVASA